MGDIAIRKSGCAGRITLTRPQALNALSHDMCRALDAALIAWAEDPEVALVILDAEGARAFCAGGDIASIHAEARRGHFEGARRFWREEYRMNARIHAYPKPLVSLMQGFTMGGGVGIGCLGSIRVVGESSRIAMPECAIGLIPDVGGTYLLARAPGRLGEYLGLTGARMGPSDAITAGFADHFVPETEWPALIAALERDGDPALIAAASITPPAAPLQDHRETIDAAFAAPDVAAITAQLAAAGGAFAAEASQMIGRGAPLSLACTLALIRAQRARPDLRAALEAEYRFTHRALDRSDFLEGVRAAVIDKDRKPQWRITGAELAARAAEMLAPLDGGPQVFTEEE